MSPFLVGISGDGQQSRICDTCVEQPPPAVFFRDENVRDAPGLYPPRYPVPLLSVNYESKRVNNDDPMGYSRSIPDEMQNDHKHHNFLGSKAVFCALIPNMLGCITHKSRMPQTETPAAATLQ